MRLTDEQIERANLVNLPQFLMSHGFDLKRVGKEYVWKEHDSLHIKDNALGEGGRWYRFSESKGGDNIGFLREYMGMSFVEAVEALNGEHYDRIYTPSRTYEPKPEKKKDGVLKIEEADNARRVFAYLCKTRGLDYDLISSLVKSGVIAQEQKTGNVLFKYYDDKGKVIGAEKVGTSTEHKFKGIATGSAGGHGFEVCRGDGSNLLFFESSIDMLSYLQMFSPDNCRLVSMMGVKPNIVLDTMVRYGIAPQNVYLCSDNDEAGNDFADRLREQYPEMKRIATPDTYKDWNDMLRGIPKVVEQEKDKKEADRKNMQYYGNEMWNKATDNRDKSLVTVRLSDFQRVQETLEKSGINYYAYEMNGTVRMAVNDKDIDWLKNILGNVNVAKSNKPYSPPERNIFGTAEYRYIPQKEYFSADRDLVLKMAEIMARRGMQFSGRVYSSGKGTLTVSHADLFAVRNIRDEVINMRKQFASYEKAQEVGNRDYRANRDTHYYMSKLTPEQFKEVKPFLETSVSYHAVARDGKVAFAVDKENAPAFHRALDNAVREVGMLHAMSDLGLTMEQNVALSPTIHRLAVEDMKLDLADFFDKRYDEAQFGEMLSLINTYLAQAPAERYGENSKLNDMLEAKSSFDRAIELSDFFSQHDFSDEQRAAITAMFVGNVTRGQIDIIDETFTAEDIQAYDEILHNALQESDVADFLTAHKQDVINRENAGRVPTEEEELFSKADLAKFLAECTLSSDEWEDMAYPLFENGYLDKHQPSEKAVFGYHLHETELFSLTERFHQGEDIRRELALGLMEPTASEDIEFVFEDGKISDRTYYYAENLRNTLHTERTEDGYKCSFGGMERFVSFEEIGQAFIDRTHEEFEDLMYWRVLDYIRDDIPDIADETVQQLITAFDGAALPDWEKGDNQPKINRIKKALFNILGNEEQTEKAFACIAKHKYNVTFEAEMPESSIHFGLLGNGITAYDVSRTDKETNDYPIVAHISTEGVVRIYDNSLSAEDMERINEQAQSAHEKFMTDWNMLSPVEQFQKLLDRADISTTININREKLSMKQTVEKYMPFVFFGEGERPEPEVKKVHQVITNAGFDGGIDDKMEYATVNEAVKAGKDYLADGYLGFSVYNQETKKIEHIEGDFPPNEAFNPNILRINSMHEMANEVQARMEQHTFETSLDKAKYLINSFCESEYDSQADFSDLHEIHIAYTTLTDDELPIQVTADLVDYKIIYEFDGEVFNTEQYDSIEDMIENSLTGIDFNYLISVPDDVIERHTADRTTFYIEASEEDVAELRNHLEMNGYDVVWSDDSKSFDADSEQAAYIETILEDRDIIYSLDSVAFNNPEQTIDLMSDAADISDISSSADNVPSITLAYKGDAESIAEIKDNALSLGAVVTVDNAEGIISISTYENHKDKLDSIAYELGLMAVVDETADIDKPLFTDDSVIEEIQRNERSNTPFWETPDVQGEQLSLFGDPEPIQQKKPEKPKSEFAKGPVVDGVQVYEALAAEIDRGTGFVGGKLRVQDFYEQQHPTLKQLADFLKKEYGTGGHSGDGNISLVDYNSKGLTFSFKNGEKYRHSWYNVAVMTDARLKDNTYLSAEQQSKRQAQKEEKLAAKPAIAPETEKSDIPTIKNLAQLKRSIKPGMMFEITDHLRPECIGERRVVTGVSTVDFTSRKLNENSEPTGKDLHMEFDRAKNWRFDGGEMTSRLNNGDVLMSFHFIDGSELSREPERVSFSEEISGDDDAVKYRIMENADERYKYNVQILTQGENGEFAYSGNGRFCETLDEAHAFIEHDKAERNADKQPDMSQNDKENNFIITDDALGEGGAKAKFGANVEAIRTLRTIESEKRPATDEEKEILSKYVGWGALAKAFDKSDPKWLAEYQELSELLTPEEYRQARASVNDAFYTSPTIIDGIYEALRNFGFEGGNVLEPAMGIGNFFGRMPEDMQSSSQLYGVEIDSLSGRIAQALYPDADIAIQGFEKNRFQNGCFDVAVGNVPFGELGFKDEKHGASKLHDYFFLEAMDKLKNGGIMAFVTSSGTLDKKDESVRQMLADKADLIGAIRLPGGKNGAFKDNAGTEVTTDIIFLQKHEGKTIAEMSDIPDWVHIGETADGLPINKYFEQHPDMVLGTVVEGNKLYGSGTMVVSEDGFDLKTALYEAVSKLSADISHERGRDVYAKTADGVQVQIPSNLRNYSFFMSDDQVFFKKNNAACEFRFDKGTAQHKRFKAFIEMRDLTRELLEAQELNKPDSVIKDLQARLNTAYDDFYAKYGLIHSQMNKRYFSEDVSYNLVAGLEKSYDKNVLKEKSDIFTKRTIVPPKAIDHVETALEALTLSVVEKAQVDFEYMGKLTGMTDDELKHDLMGEIFKVPHTENGYQTASEYLSGDIRAKLREAEEIAEYDADFNINVSSLKAVMPEPLKAGDIDVKIGATWLDPKYYEQFIYELLQTPKYQRSDSPASRWKRSAVIGVEYSEHSNSYHISNKSADRSVLATQKFGSHKMNAYDIFEHILNLQEPKVYKTIEVPDPDNLGETKEKRVVDIDATRVVQRKADNIRKAFKNWIFKDPVRREDIVQRYNELFNSIRPREYDGSALSFPLMTADIQLHDHQKNAIAHALFGGNTLFAHSVGAGKTFEMIATAMESKRLGLCTKSLFAVPNHLTEQIGDDFQKLYPSANILVATKKDFQKANRQQLFAKIATGNYDAVIIGHSQLGMIPISKERQVMTIQSQIDDILQGIDELKRNEGSKFQIKAMERTRKSLQKQLDKLEKSNQDDTLTFEQLGVDKIFVDEAHECTTRS